MYRKGQQRTLVVFVTGSEEFYPAAFGVHAFDYLLKPVSERRLEVVLDDAAAFLGLGESRLVLDPGRGDAAVLLREIVC